MRFFVELSFNGKNYHGWQIQPDAVSIQEVLENAFSTLLREEVKLTGAGRTDTGVHARQLFAHFDTPTEFDLSEMIFRLNSFLPKDIAIKEIFKVKAEAHARFDATEREYKYQIALAKDPFLQDFAYNLHVIPDIEAMNAAAELLLSHQDFQCFSRSNTDVKTYYCDVKTAFWKMEGKLLVFTICADRFLRNMVRAIVGTLLEVGLGKKSLDDFRDVLQSKDRTKAGASAPAHGLFLTRVGYPNTIRV